MALNGKVALVTGAGQGIGKAIALKFGREKCSVVVNDINIDNAKHVSQEIINGGGVALALRADVANFGEVSQMAKLVFSHFLRIDILVNNAAISPRKEGGRVPVYEIDEEDWNRVININLKGVFNCCKAIIPYMIAHGGGRIINISSEVAKSGGRIFGSSGAHYAASKAGIIGFTKSLAMELAQNGILANCVAPGTIETPLRQTSKAEINKALMEAIPLKRFGKPEEVAEAVYFLASEVSSYITGEILDVNGGVYMD